jgi:hypothetical protein
VENIPWNPSRLFEYGLSFSSWFSSLTSFRNWNTAFGVNGSVGSVTATMPPQPLQHAHHEESGLVDSLGGAHTSSSSYVPTTVGISNSFVSPGMWQDSVAAATGFSESGKRMFHFGDDNTWSNPPSTRVMGTPTTAASAGTALRANGASSRGH